MYNQLILEHFNRPRNRERGTCGPSAKLNNRMCGDEIEVSVGTGQDGRIERLMWSGRGCSIMIAGASMMSEILTGKTHSEALAVRDLLIQMLRGEPGSFESLGDLNALSLVRRYPLRSNCALLPWQCLCKIIETAKEVTA